MASTACTLAELVTYFTSTDASNPNPFKLVLTGTYRSPLADLVLALHKSKRVSVVRPPDTDSLLVDSAVAHANGANGHANENAQQSALPKHETAGGGERQPSSILKQSAASGERATHRERQVARQAHTHIVSRKFSEGRRMLVGRPTGSMLVQSTGATAVAEDDDEADSGTAAAGLATQAAYAPVRAGRPHNGEGRKRGSSRERTTARDVKIYWTTDPPIPKHVSFQETPLQHEFDTVSIDSSTADEDGTLEGPDAQQVDPVLEAFRRWVGSSARKSLSLAVPIAMPVDGSGHPVRRRQRPLTVPADMLDALAQRIAAEEAAEQEAVEQKRGAVRASDDQLFGSKAARRRAARITLV